MNKYILLLYIMAFCITGCGSKTDSSNLPLEAESFEESETEDNIVIPYSITVMDVDSDLYKAFLRDENEEFVKKLYWFILDNKQKTKEEIASNSYLVEISDSNNEPSEIYYFDKDKKEKTHIFENIFKAIEASMVIRNDESKDERIVLQNPEGYYDILKIYNYLSQTNLDENDNSSPKEKLVLEVMAANKENLYYVSPDYPKLYNLLEEYFDGFFMPLAS